MQIERMPTLGDIVHGDDSLAHYRVTNQSPFASKPSTMDIYAYPSDMAKYLNGALIQTVFPYLTADQREFMTSGFTPEEWEETFGCE